MTAQTSTIHSSQKTFSKKYEDLFRFVEKTGEEVFVMPKKRKVGIIFKPIEVIRKEFELKDALSKIQRGKEEYQTGKSEKFENFLKNKYPQYAKSFAKNS